MSLHPAISRIFNEKRTKCRYRDHDDRDARLLLLPENEPDNVDIATCEFDACNSDDGYDNHCKRKTKPKPYTNLLTGFDLDLP